MAREIQVGGGFEPKNPSSGWLLTLKVPMKWNFNLLFYSKLLKSMILWFVIFKFGLRTSAYEVFLELQSWPIRLKMCDIPHVVKIFKLVWLTSHLQAIIASEGNKWRSGKFFVTGGPVLASCKTPLTRKALSCLYFRKTKSEEHIVSDLFGYCKATNASMLLSPFRTKFLSAAFKQCRSSAMEMS